jgi:hypothetical protein
LVPLPPVKVIVPLLPITPEAGLVAQVLPVPV